MNKKYSSELICLTGVLIIIIALTLKIDGTLGWLLTSLGACTLLFGIFRNNNIIRTLLRFFLEFL